jgi:uncharacterized protein (TIGR04255 family)
VALYRFGGGLSVALTLPAPSTEKLDRSPLSLVVCQVRHERTVTASEPKRAVSVHDALKESYPVLEEQAGQELTIAAGQLGVQTLPGAVQRGWKLRSNDQLWNAIVMPDFFSLETTRYADWPDFRGRLEEFARAVSAAVEPSLEQRVGLRFIDRIAHPDVTEPAGWIDWIDRSFLGPIAHEKLGQAVVTSQQILQLDMGNGHSVILRHGAVRDQEASGEMTYLIDQDCFTQRGRPFDVDQMLDAAEQLHTLALQVFQQAITPELYQYLKGEG